MVDIQPPERVTDLPISVIKNMMALATSGFGLVVALAWNQLIQEFVKNYITPYLGPDSGIISLFIYAVVVTLLAILVTMQLSMAQKGLENLERRRHPERYQKEEL